MPRPLARIAGLAAAFLALVAAAADRAPSAERGRQVFTAVGCVHCHGTHGQGTSAGARLAPNPLPAPAIAQFLRSTATNMPTYSAQVLSDADVADIAAYLASLPAPKKPDDIPALRDLGRPLR
jgi:mono/diheme cytochrome c family protein